MYKSAIGIFISNLLMILLVLLNNEGPGWEVPMSTMQNISQVSYFLRLSFIFVIITFIIGLRKLKVRSLSFKISYFIYLIYSIVILIFLFRVQAFQGQFWFVKFPRQIFILFSVGVTSLFFIIISYFRFKKNKNNPML